jgi:glycosyltransferase involved in cell wall biosynthesis
MVMIEALACGTPVVGTPCGAAPEIVDDGVTGFLRSGPQGLVDAIGQLGALDRADCRAAVDARFSMARMASDHLAAYAALLEHQAVGDAEIADFMREQEGTGDDVLATAG